MPLSFSKAAVKWLIQMQIVDSSSESDQQISYNDQIYFQNGYSIGLLLRKILKNKGLESDGLLRIRKIAHISSNENWKILMQILKQINFEEEIDLHCVTLQQIENIVQFLFRLFGPQPLQRNNKKSKIYHIDPTSFNQQKPITQSNNLLQFVALAALPALDISLAQFLGLLINNAHYFKQTIILGKGNQGFKPVITMFQKIVANMITLNNLIEEQTKNQSQVLNILACSILSQNSHLNKLGCLMITNLQSTEWLERQGRLVMLKSPHYQTIQLLLRILDPNFHLLFTPNLHQHFTNVVSQLRYYTQILKYIYKSIHSKNILQLLPLNYYIFRAISLFQPQVVQASTVISKLAAKHLLATIVCLYWTKLSFFQKNQIHMIFDVRYSASGQEKYTTVCHLFDILKDIDSSQIQYFGLFFSTIQGYYTNGNQGLREFIIDNYLHLYRSHTNKFPIQMFLANQEIVNSVQSNHYILLQLLSQRKDLLPQEAHHLLKICRSYFKTQLHAKCFEKALSNLIKNNIGLEWAIQTYEEILDSWLNMKIPSFNATLPTTNKIKLRQIGLKKKQMLQFTELNRYKFLLNLVSNVKNLAFLNNFAKKISSTIRKVQKSQSKQLKASKTWLNQLLALVDARKYQSRQQRAQSVVNISYQQTVGPLGLANKQQQDYFQQELSQSKMIDHFQQQFQHNVPQQETPIQQLQDSQNQFIQLEKNTPFQNTQTPLLPFSDKEQINFNFSINYPCYILFQQYEITYIKLLNTRHQLLLKYIARQYQKSISVQHFLQLTNILSYFKNQISILNEINQQLKLSFQNTYQIAQKLIVQTALLAFEFKKQRRITIKCVQSFYELLQQKNGILKSNSSFKNSKIDQILPETLNFHRQSKIQNNQSILQNSIMKKSQLFSKIEFSYTIAPQITRQNKFQPFKFCFELVSQFVFQAIGINLIEPFSFIVTQVNPLTQISRVTKKDYQQAQTIKSLINQNDQIEYQQLQKIVDSQTAPAAFSNKKRLRTVKVSESSMKNSLVLPKQKAEKLIQIKKKIAKRRLQMQKKYNSQSAKALNP